MELPGSHEGPQNSIIISGDNCLYSIKYMLVLSRTGRPFKGAWLKDCESVANLFSARIYMKVIITISYSMPWSYSRWRSYLRCLVCFFCLPRPGVCIDYVICLSLAQRHAIGLFDTISYLLSAQPRTHASMTVRSLYF